MSTTRAKAAHRGARTKPKRKALSLTAAYLPAQEGGYTAEILEAIGVHSQGDTFEEARANLHAAVALMLEEAPHQFQRKKAVVPPGAILEKLFALVVP
jgi:predicted RNase H-like HicB family nuclease